MVKIANYSHGRFRISRARARGEQGRGLRYSHATKWMISQQWGGRENFPLMPAVLVLVRAITGRRFVKITEIEYRRAMIEMNAKKDSVKWIVPKKQWEEFCRDTFKKISENPKFQKYLVKNFQKRAFYFLNFCKKVMATHLKTKLNKELWQYYQKYIRLYEDIYVWGESFAFGSRFQLSDYLSNYLKKILKKRNKLEKFDEYFNTLITPLQKPFITEEKENLLKTALKIEKNSKLEKLFKKNLKTIKKEIIKFPVVDKTIEKHTQDWQWVPYNYGAFLYTKEYFLKELRELISKKKIKEELNKIRKRYGNLIKKQKEIIKNLKIDKYHQKLFEALRWNSFIIDYKKKIFTISHFLINFSLMKEIAKRLKIAQKYAHCLLEDEMKEALLKNKLVPLEILRERFKRAVVFIKDGKVKLMIKKEAEDFLKKQGVREEKLAIKEFKGDIANSGEIQGITKVIPGPKDFKKMKEGNILVTHMTTPEFGPILKKAAAIITDEGGITCHAAIVSRELGIPCIIGTKIATKVLKDGDFVAVEANRGVVKILKKA